MKFYSEMTNQLYNTEDELLIAEKAQLDKQKEEAKKASKRAERAKEVEEAAKAAVEAQKIYKEKLNAFTKDYGSFHMTLKDGDVKNPFGLFDLFFN